MPDDRWQYRYAPGIWTTKEVFQHIIDVERVFAYLALPVARNHRNDLPNLDEDAYQAKARTHLRDIVDVLREL